MNLLARLFGTGTYIFALLIFSYLLLKNSKKSKKILFIYSLVLSLMAFLFKPSNGNDLYRIFDLMHIYSEDNLNVFLERLQNSASPASLIYFRIIGKIGLDGLLPAITCFIFYTNIFYIFNDYTKKRNFSSKTLAIALIIIMCNSSYFEIISGIRTMLSFSIFIRCFYTENYRNKNFFYNLPFYIVASLIHPIGIIVFAIRLLYIFLERLSKRSITNILFLLFYIISVVIFFKYGWVYIKGALDISESYIMNSGYSYFWENLITVLLFILVFILQRKTKNNKEEKECIEKISKNKRYSLIYELLIIGFCFEHNIFFRLNNFNLFLNIPIILYAIENMVKSEKKDYKYLTLYALLILSLSVARGNLCSLKFW